MRSYLALLLLAASFTGCAREPSDSVQAPTANSAAGATSSIVQGASPGAAIKPMDIATAAKTQQEGSDTGTATDTSEATLERIAALPPAGQLPTGPWVAGTNYQVLSPAQPTDVPAGKVEVVEMFWYACPHCYALDPMLESWRQNKPAYVEFRRVPVMWGEEHRAHAHLFYTLKALGKLEQLHSKVFEEIHQKGNLLFVAGDPNATLQAQLQFARANGIQESDFVSAYNSFGVQNNLQQADDLVRRDKIDAVPTIVIDGKYVTDVEMAGSASKLIQLVDDLAASDKHR
jgi:thiol:disulfide interchange protein DsbA